MQTNNKVPEASVETINNELENKRFNNKIKIK